MLDTNKYKDNMTYGFPDPSGFISQETFKWIEKCSLLAKKKNARIITVMHQNQIDHVEGITDGYTIDNSAEALKVFQNCGLNLVLSGHIHVQNIECNKSSKIPTYDIVTSALSVYPQQYGVIKYSPTNGFDYSTSKVDVEGWAKASNVKDNNLLNFKKYSKSFFELQAYNKAYNRLSKTDGLTDDKKKLMAKTMASLNLKQFSGTMNENMNEILNSKGYKLLISSNPGFLKHYGISTANNTINNNKLHISNK
jgi:3',5'-cyclic AMP phosphodiesterase CpdA